MNKNTFKIIFVLIGAMVGAGLASGKEIFVFFSIYGNIGIIGAIFSSFLTSLIIYKTMKLVKYFKLDNYKDFTALITNKNTGISNKIFSNIVNIFLYFSFIIMISGFGAFFHQAFNINTIIPIIFLSFYCFYLFNSSVTAIVRLNFVLVPFLIFVILFYSFKHIYINYSLPNILPVNLFSLIISSILYSSYNSVLLVPVIISLNKIATKLENKNIRIISLSCFIILSVLSISVINLLFSLDNNLVTSLDMPILFAIKDMGIIHYFIYGFIILIAILTSAVSSGYSLVNIFKKNKNYRYISFIICLSSILFYKIDFSYLISSLYPILGVIGIIQILYLLLKKAPKTDIN